jgi:hypothetical protein
MGIQVWEGDGAGLPPIPIPPQIILVPNSVVDEATIEKNHGVRQYLVVSIRTRVHRLHEGSSCKGGSSNPGARSAIASFRRLRRPKSKLPWPTTVVQILRVEHRTHTFEIENALYWGKDSYTNDGYGIAYSVHRFSWPLRPHIGSI